MASNEVENQSETTSQEQAFNKSCSLRGSDHNDSATFVRFHVKNRELEPKVVDDFGEFDRSDYGTLPSRLAKRMREVIGSKADEIHGFQPLVNEALMAMVTRNCPLGVTAKTKQGVATSPSAGRMNFNRCNINTRIDICVLLADNAQSIIGVCEVKKLNESLEAALNQQFCATVTKQRSVQKSDLDGLWLLPGLVVYADRAYITMLETGSWWGYTAQLKYINEFSFQMDDQGPNSDSECAYQLMCVLDRYIKLLFSSTFTKECVSCKPVELPYFAYPASVRRLYSPHIALCTFRVAKSHVLREESSRFISPNYEQVSDDELVVVKTLSVGLYAHAASETLTLETLLDLPAKNNQIQLKIILKKMQTLGLEETASGVSGSGEPMKAGTINCLQSVAHLYLWIGDLPDSRCQAIITRYMGEPVCANKAVLKLWKSDSSTRSRFFEQVCLPAMRLITLGYLHGDIRPPNIVARVVDTEVSFTLIDWDNVRRTSADRSVPNDNRYPALSHIEDADERSLLFTVCQLYVTSIIIDRVATLANEDAKELEEEEWKNKSEFWHVPKALHQTRKIHFWARMRRFHELVAAMKPNATKDSRSVQRLTKIIKAALQI